MQTLYLGRKTRSYYRYSHSKNFNNNIHSFCARCSAQAEVQRVLCYMCCSLCMSLNSVQSFVIENCNGPPIENGRNNVCLHLLSRAFTFFYLDLSFILSASLDKHAYPIKRKASKTEVFVFSYLQVLCYQATVHKCYIKIFSVGIHNQHLLVCKHEQQTYLNYKIKRI